MIFKTLFHGHDTFTEEHSTYTIYFNKDFPDDEHYNFITLDQPIEDIDLFDIIQAEDKIHRYISTNNQSNQLFKSLNFEIEHYAIYEAKKISKQHEIPYAIEEIDDLKNYQEYRNSYTHPLIEQKYLKAKKNHIIVVRDQDKIIGSMILHERKDFVEIDDLYVLKEYRNQKVASSLINFAFHYQLPVRIITDVEGILKGFRKLESITVATK